MNKSFGYYDACVLAVYPDCAYVTGIELKTKCHIYKRVLHHRHSWIRPEPGDDVTLEVSQCGYQIKSIRSQPSAHNSYNDFSRIIPVAT